MGPGGEPVSGPVIGFVLFDQVTQLDLTGPLQILSRTPGAATVIAASTLEPVATDAVVRLSATYTFATCPQLDLICVPGGPGVLPALEDAETLAFIARQAKGARYVTSVCTGALLLGAAGLLRGKRATTHWAYRDLLPAFGATPAEGRVVRDGNTFTGGGVTAGMDFGLTVLAELAGEAVARQIQLAVEYDPAPPFASGSPATATPETLGVVAPFYQTRVAAYREVVSRITGT
jgi:cyclohexyl-isocyanide hydratase